MKTKIIIALIGVISIISSWQNNVNAQESKKGMVKVTILYPNGEDKTFDMDYYSNKHMPMLKTLMGDSLKFYEIDKGISGRTPDEPMPYLAIGYLYFDKLSDYQESFGPNAEKIVGDIPNYTNIQPILQISEVLH
ncbi:EthD family reductase [Croceitalea rosinachiae]|uniref:EthD family reductase n=1 Tax=Croceitalea rosinachiae TaxID=3075596 RepID=A0ABU3AAH9_9FLAO|nr:EthD family reductase [Croceitalea sp. F388]MDT0607191.1 EthD family reductase [Croceitalea sp. F388]